MSERIIDKSTEVVESDMVTTAGVYAGLMSNLYNINRLLKWNIQYSGIIEGNYKYLSLKEIEKQVAELSKTHKEIAGRPSCIYIIFDGPMSSDIWCYGNHGDVWEKRGSVAGYA